MRLNIETNNAEAALATISRVYANERVEVKLTNTYTHTADYEISDPNMKEE